MNFIKKLIGKGSKSSDCCGVEIKEVERIQEESCCGTLDAVTPSGNTTNEQHSSCC